jgi:putative ABC transport system permease protein
MLKQILNAMRTGLLEIRAHKTRSVLSFLSIAVGSVVFMDAFASIYHTYKMVRMQKETSGIARLRIAPQYSNWGDVESSKKRDAGVLTYDDVVDLKTKMPELFMVSPEANDWDVVSYKDRRFLSSMSGITPEWRKRDFFYKLRGRFLDWDDVKNTVRVCVVIKRAIPPPSNSLYKAVRQSYDYTRKIKDFIAHTDLLGKTIKLNKFDFTVIGVLEELPESKRPMNGFSFGQSSVLAPITTMQKYGIVDTRRSLELEIDTGEEQTFYDKLKNIKQFLQIRFGDLEAFSVQDKMDDYKSKVRQSIMNAMATLSLGMLAFIAGGIGIMNVTLATVFARTKEIGIRRALGASRWDIMLQFMVEGVMLGLMGGLLGSVLGYFWGGPIKVILGMPQVYVEPWMALIAILIAAFTAFAFAIYPAWLAASLKPADALRTE